MTLRRSTQARLLALLAAGALALTACGGGGADGSGGGGQAGGGTLGAIDLSGASFTVGSKEFTEQQVLGQIAVRALQETGADVGDLVSITGTQNVRTALTAGEIDMYWEYTGTAWTVHLQREAAEAPRDEMELFQTVKEADAANGVTWLSPAPLNNTYAIATEQGRSAELGVTNLTEYAALVASNPAEARMCAAAEFLSRDDGLPGLASVYGFDLGADGVVELELSLVPPQVASGESCNFGEVTATDGAVAANNLLVLEDDKSAFVKYNVAMTVGSEVAAANPRLAEVFDPISALLTDEVARGLNERADVGGELPEDVAEQWLQENGFIG